MDFRLLVASLVLAGAGALPAHAADVAVSVQISQPGVYGRIDIGRYPQPTLVVQQPVLVTRVAAPPAPIYMWVPPGHQKHWAKHCARYAACGAPVYFVRDEWYRQNVRGDKRGRGGKHGHSPH